MPSIKRSNLMRAFNEIVKKRLLNYEIKLIKERFISMDNASYNCYNILQRSTFFRPNKKVGHFNEYEKVIHTDCPKLALLAMQSNFSVKWILGDFLKKI